MGEVRKRKGRLVLTNAPPSTPTTIIVAATLLLLIFTPPTPILLSTLSLNNIGDSEEADKIQSSIFYGAGR